MCSADDEDCVVNLDAMCDFQVPAVTLDMSDGSGDLYSGSGTNDVFEEGDCIMIALHIHTRCKHIHCTAHTLHLTLHTSSTFLVLH